MTEEENKLFIEALEESEVKLEKIGYNYNGLTQDQAKRLLDILISRNEGIKVILLLKRIDVKGNELKK